MTGPKFYFDTFYTGDRGNKISIFMSFKEDHNRRFDEVIKPAVENITYKEDTKYKIEKVDDEKSGREIQDKIYEAIESSKLLIFDFSKDDRYETKNDIYMGFNPNVVYELGLARGFRCDKDILLITDIENIKENFFTDIGNMTINCIDKNNFQKENFKNLLESVLDKQKFYEDKRLTKVASLLDSNCLRFLLCWGLNQEGSDLDHFNDRNFSPQEQISLTKLLDLNIVYTAIEKNGWEYAYHFTPLGRAVIKHLNLKREEGMICYGISNNFQLLLMKEKQEN